MRFLLGVVFGILLIVGAAFIADSSATAEGAAGAEPRRIVNWNVAGDRLHDFTETIRAGLKKLAG
jgi:Tol biopolymer transport system component